MELQEKLSQLGECSEEGADHASGSMAGNMDKILEQYSRSLDMLQDTENGEAVPMETAEALPSQPIPEVVEIGSDSDDVIVISDSGEESRADDKDVDDDVALQSEASGEQQPLEHGAVAADMSSSKTPGTSRRGGSSRAESFVFSCRHSMPKRSHLH